MISAMEATDEVPAEEGHEPEAVLGEGDLLDDFIETAQCPDDTTDGAEGSTAGQAAVLTPQQAAAAARLEAARRAGARAAAADGASSDEEEFDSDVEAWSDGGAPGELVPPEEWLRARQQCALPTLCHVTRLEVHRLDAGCAAHRLPGNALCLVLRCGARRPDTCHGMWRVVGCMVRMLQCLAVPGLP